MKLELTPSRNADILDVHGTIAHKEVSDRQTDRQLLFQMDTRSVLKELKAHTTYIKRTKS